MNNIVELDLIKNKYIVQLKCLKDTYLSNCKKFNEKIDRINEKFKYNLEIKKNNKDNEYYCINDYFESELIDYYEELKYHYLSGILQSIGSLWENQLNDFYLLEELKDYNSIKEKLKNDGYYDLDNDLNIREIRSVYNYLKHGEFGSAKKYLVENDSIYFNNDNMNGEVRGNILRNKTLNICYKDIEKFFNTFICFWESIYKTLRLARQ